MNGRNLLILACVAGLFLGFALFQAPQKPNKEKDHFALPTPEMFYGQCIDGIIERGKQQCARLCETESSHLKADAEFLAHKVAFCQKNRGQLIQEMARVGVHPSPNTVERFVIERFVRNREKASGPRAD